MVFVEPLDLQSIFINTLAGTTEIFTFLAFIVVAALAAFFKMPNTITLAMFALFSVLMAQYLGGVFMLVVLIVGLITFFIVARLVK